MEYEITPEPTPEEREALIAALERLLAETRVASAPAAHRSAWRRAGIAENLAPWPAVGEPKWS